MAKFIRLGEKKYIEQILGEDDFEDTNETYNPQNYFFLALKIF